MTMTSLTYRTLAATTFLLMMLPVDVESAQNAARPNILWITAEDMSADLGCYGDTYATTPNLDQLAKQSTRYTHAFATAPVCSPARSCLITGVYATSLGTQRLRSHFKIPADHHGFAQLLRDEGYFTSNNVKTDYNVANERQLIDACWSRNGSDAHWRQRAESQPFFSVFNLMVTHQSRTSVWPFEEFEREVGQQLISAQRHDPANAPIAPYFPDIPSVRQTMARYYDCISAMDQQVGRLLEQLREDGLAEDTIVFFFSDHGRGIPRGKRVLHDSGLHVPLLIRFPRKFRHLAPSMPGQDSNRLVSFVDFAPTVLSLVGVQVPEYMQGRAFLGEQAESPRDYVFGARDRVDEVFDLARSVRNERYLYIRNYMPHLSWMPTERYSDASVMRQDLQRLLADGQLDATQLTYASPTREREELYDTTVDPHQIQNLAQSREHQRVLQRLRDRLTRWELDTRDLGFLTEPDVLARFPDSAPRNDAGKDERYPLERILHAAELVGDSSAADAQTRLLDSDERAVRYWATVGLNANANLSPQAMQALKQATNDTAPEVRIEAAAALMRREPTAETLKTLTDELTDERAEVVLHAMRALECLGDIADSAASAIESARQRAATEEAKADANPCWMFVRFSAEAALL